MISDEIINPLKIAIPNKGRLSQQVYELLEKSGLSFPPRNERILQVSTYDKQYVIIFVRAQDIPRFVEMNVADVGFTGEDIIEELQCDVEKIMPLGFGNCDMVVAVKEEDIFETVSDLPKQIKVATSFPNIAKKFFEQHNKTAKIIEISGACEITPRLGLSDVVVDITSSGATLKSNKLRIIGTILSSSAAMIAKKNLPADKLIKKQSLIRAVKSVIDSRDKKYLMAHVPKNILPKIKEFLPGLSSPTVTTLFADENNVVIHVVVDAKKVYESVEKIKSLGGSGILIMTVDQMVK